MTEQQLRLKLLARALEWLGATRGDAKHKEILDTYNKHTPLPRGYAVQTKDAWCAAFVSACAIATGNDDIIPVECSCNRQIAAWQSMGRWQEDDNYSPAVGDVIYYDWHDTGKGDNLGEADHVGIVANVRDGMMLVIEGNKGNDSRAGYRSIAVGGKFIRGYGLPDYASKADAPVCEVTLLLLKRGDTGKTVRSVQTLLNLRIGAGLEVDGSFGPATEQALKTFQRMHSLRESGICDAAEWRALIEG